jgi:hypothetical protein
MDELIADIKNILHLAPARSSIIMYKALIEQQPGLVKVTIESTLEFYATRTNDDWSTPMLTDQRHMEKIRDTGLAIGSLETFLKDRSIPYDITYTASSNDEIKTEVLIHA